MEERCRLRPRAVRSRGIGYRIRRRVDRLPHDLAVRGVERRQNIVVEATGEAIDGLADDDGRRVSLPQIDLPSALQVLGPRLRLCKSAGRAVAVMSSPLRIILRRDLG